MCIYGVSNRIMGVLMNELQLEKLAAEEGKESEFRKYLTVKIVSQENEIMKNPYLGKWKVKYLGFRLLNPGLFRI